MTLAKRLHTFNQAMGIRLISLALVLVLAGSAGAGMPLHSNEQECNLPEMAGMDCCKMAVQPESFSSEDLIARLCCSLNCSQPGTVARGPQLPRPSAVQALAIYAPVIPPLGDASRVCLSNWAHSPPPFSNPAYIRHLALLI